MLEGEMSSHLALEKTKGSKNKRNGSISKKVLTEAGNIAVNTPRDRYSSFKPELLAKRQTELSSGLDEQIPALYAQGNSIEDVRRLLVKIYGIEISAGKISQITDKVLPEIETLAHKRIVVILPCHLFRCDTFQSETRREI